MSQRDVRIWVSPRTINCFGMRKKRRHDRWLAAAGRLTARPTLSLWRNAIAAVPTLVKANPNSIAAKVKSAPAGWFFEHHNEFYPDVDDSAQVCLGLSRVEHPNGRYQRESVQRAIDWILSMQCRNGGWASFDKDNDRMVFQHVPFADHNAMIDPSCEDITGRTLEAVDRIGVGRDVKAVRRAVAYLKRTQDADGTWYGRWGCNYIYGTWSALAGLNAAGIDAGAPEMRRAAEDPVVLFNTGNAYKYLDVMEKGPGFSTLLWDFLDGKPKINHFRSRGQVPAETPVSRAMSIARMTS